MSILDFERQYQEDTMQPHDFNPAIQKVLNSAQYGSHPRLRRIDSPITRAFNAENNSFFEVNRSTVGLIGLLKTVSGVRKRGSCSQFDIPKRLPPNLQRVQDKRIEAVSHVPSHRRRVTGPRPHVGEAFVPQGQPDPTRHTPDQSLQHMSDALSPLSAATRHAQRRAMLLEQIRQPEVRSRDSFIDTGTRYPAASSFTIAKTLRSKSAGADPVVPDTPRRLSQESLAPKTDTRQSLSKEPFQSKFTENMCEPNSFSTSSDRLVEPEHVENVKQVDDPVINDPQSPRKGMNCKLLFKWC